VTPIIRCERVSKSYSKGGALGVKELLVGRHRRVGRFNREWAIRDVSFDVAAGEAFGIVGLNGSGKSTLLALVLGALRADSGRISVAGRVASLLELGSGFHPELTGRQNVFLYGSILGMRIREIRARFDDIVEFSELGNAIDNPLRTYSNGMVTRLGFSVIIHAEADVLLIDEVLAVGDLEFQEKCREFLREYKRRGCTLVVVSHDLRSLQSICQNGLFLNEGRVVKAGAIGEVIAGYRGLVEEQARLSHPGRASAG
jgi:ABC-2 type transport system ATP-binding protein